MFNSNNDNRNSIDNEDFPDFFEAFDEALKKGVSPGYYDSDELCEIIDIYFSEGKVKEGKYTIDYALKLYQRNEDLICDLLLLLNDYELWNDLLTLSEQYIDICGVWGDGHKLTALLHLGVEEDAFQYFKKMKSKHAEDQENLSIIYQAMGEALYEVDLYDAAIEVIEEALSKFDGEEEVDLLWIQLLCFTALNDKENVLELAHHIQSINPLDAEIWSRLGEIYKDVGEMEKAIEACEFAQSLGLKDPTNLLNMIFAYENNDNYAKALQKTEEYLNDYPNNYLVYLYAIELCSEIEDWEKGIKFSEIAIELDPYSESLYLYLCKFYLKLGENTKAISALEEGIKCTEDVYGELKKQLELLKTPPTPKGELGQ